MCNVYDRVMARRTTKPDKTATLRERHNATTRELILEALVGQLVEVGAFDFSYYELARRAGVSVPTVYRHFATRELLFEALGKRVNAVVGLREYPRTRDGVAATVRALFPKFDQHAALIRAQMQAGFTGTRQVARHRRVGLFDQVMAVALPNLTAERRREAAGLMTCLVSAHIWQRLRDELDLDGTRSGELTAWAVDTLWRALEVEDDRARKRS